MWNRMFSTKTQNANNLQKNVINSGLQEIGLTCPVDEKLHESVDISSKYNFNTEQECKEGKIKYKALKSGQMAKQKQKQQEEEEAQRQNFQQQNALPKRRDMFHPEEYGRDMRLELAAMKQSREARPRYNVQYPNQAAGTRRIKGKKSRKGRQGKKSRKSRKGKRTNKRH